MLNVALTQNFNEVSIPQSPIVHRPVSHGLNENCNKTNIFQTRDVMFQEVCVKKCYNCARQLYPNSNNEISNLCNKDCATSYVLRNRSNAPLYKGNISPVPMMPQISPIENHHKMRKHIKEVSSSKNNYWERNYDRRREMMELENSKYCSDTESDASISSVEDNDNLVTNKETENKSGNGKLKRTNSAVRLLYWILRKNKKMQE